MNLIDLLTIHKTFLVDAISFWWSQVRYNASSRTEADREKLEYVLLRENHTIEKGISLRHPRKGFGQQKVRAFLSHLSLYQQRYGAETPDFLRYPLSTVRYWLDYTQREGTDVTPIAQQWEQLAAKVGLLEVEGHAGVREASAEEILSAARGDFASLLSSRHSMRYFDPRPVAHELIDRALALAQLTPSACNRQGWKTHVYEGPSCHQLLEAQGGSRGFEQEVPAAIVVTANQKAFLYYEMHQAYVDGGLYAMNLINALHFLGLGTIPLSCGFKQRKLRRIKRQFGIPECEVPILIIGFGHLEPSVKVAVSTRKAVTLTNTYHS